MSEALLFLMVVALGAALRRAFVRIEQLERAQSRPAEPAMSQATLPAESNLPPTGESHETGPDTGGSHETERDSGERRGVPPSHARGFGLLDHRSLGKGGQPEAPPAAVVAPAMVQETTSPELRSFRLQKVEDPESLETQIGTQWLLYIGVIAIVIGVAYFEKLAIDNRWIGETARVIQGAVLGLVLTFVGTRFVRAGYALYGQMIAGGGGAILYLSTYAAFNFYHLIDRPVAFGLMIAITAMVAWLADRRQSQGLALLAVGGGFATPFLLPGTTDAQLAVFGYDAILIGGTVLLSRRRNWPILNIVSYVFTLCTVAAWAAPFYTSAKFLPTELFITLFCAMFVYILRECYRSGQVSGKVVALILGTAPVVYYLASIAILTDHPTAMLVWLVAVMLAGGVLSTGIGTGAGLAVWFAVTLPLMVWIQLHMGQAWLVPGLATVGGVYAIALASQLYCAFERDEFEVADILWLHGNGLLMFASAYVLIDAAVHTPITGAVAAAFGLWQWGLAAGIVKRRRDHAIHFVTLGFTFLSIAIALQFDGPAITIGWAVEGALVVALGLRERRDWLRMGGVLLFAVAVGRTVMLLASDAPVGHVVFLNSRAACALVVIALSYGLAWLHYREPDAPDRDLGIGAGLITAQVVAVALLTSEINAYWALREWTFERQLGTSVTWGVYATVLIIIGLKNGYAPIRYFAILVFSVTIVKVFAVDMAELERIYRVASVIGLGTLLLVTSYLYSRSRRAHSAIDDRNGRG